MWILEINLKRLKDGVKTFFLIDYSNFLILGIIWKICPKFQNQNWSKHDQLFQSSHNSWTPLSICLTIWLGHSGELREFLSICLTIWLGHWGELRESFWFCEYNFSGSTLKFKKIVSGKINQLRVNGGSNYD